MPSSLNHFDHPHNNGHPSRWHVREDGWLGASSSRQQAWELEPDNPLVLSSLLYLHSGAYNSQPAAAVAATFAKLPPLRVDRVVKKHRGYEITRES